MKGLFKVRNRANKGWSHFDNNFIDQYTPVLGAITGAVYMTLCRHADMYQKCFPSERVIANELDLSERTVRSKIKILKQLNIIAIEKSWGLGGKFRNNIYWLVDKSEWREPSFIKTGGILTPSPTAFYSNNQRQELPCKNKECKNKNIKNINKFQNFKKLIPINNFIPNSKEELICKDIAMNIGDLYINTIRSCFEKYGIQVLEKAWGLYKEQSKKGGAYFMGILKKIAEESH